MLTVTVAKLRGKHIANGSISVSTTHILSISFFLIQGLGKDIGGVL